tara:strand:- start:987 stop:1466 length:480 start_codon:yes stop_codon:yes gene_type:complete
MSSNIKPSKTVKIKKRSVEMTIALLGDTFNLPRELTKKIEKDTFWADWKPSLLPKDFVDECDTQIAFDITHRYKGECWVNGIDFNRRAPNSFSAKLPLQEKLYWKTLWGLAGLDQRFYYTHREYTDDGSLNFHRMRLENGLESGKKKHYKKLYMKSWGN